VITDQVTDNSVLEKVEVTHVKNASPPVQGQKQRGFFDLETIFTHREFLKQNEPYAPFFVCLRRGRQ
jgi:hypothetical protein